MFNNRLDCFLTVFCLVACALGVLVCNLLPELAVMPQSLTSLFAESFVLLLLAGTVSVPTAQALSERN